MGGGGFPGRKYSRSHFGICCSCSVVGILICGNWENLEWKREGISKMEGQEEEKRTIGFMYRKSEQVLRNSCCRSGFFVWRDLLGLIWTESGLQKKGVVG